MWKIKYINLPDCSHSSAAKTKGKILVYYGSLLIKWKLLDGILSVSYLLERLRCTLRFLTVTLSFPPHLQVIVVETDGHVLYNKMISKLPLFMGEWCSFSYEITRYTVIEFIQSWTTSLCNVKMLLLFFPADDIIVFSPSTFFIVIHTNYGLDLEIQLKPIMQVHIKASVSNKGKLSGVFYFLSIFDCTVKYDMMNIARGIKALSSSRPLWRF